MAINTAELKKRLEEEKAKLIEELKKVGRINPDNPDDWIPTPSALTEETSDESEMADRVEEFEERTAVEGELEGRLRAVLRALKKIEEGTYGICNAAGSPHPIEEKRLEANPASRNCLSHMKEYGS